MTSPPTITISTKLIVSVFAPASEVVPDAQQPAAREERRREVAAKLESLAAEQPDSDGIRWWWLMIVQWLIREPRETAAEAAAERDDPEAGE
jgi:hypothetical protein